MAKIDTTHIEGYAEMTAEQKLAALEALEIAEPDYTGYVKKDVLDAKAKEAAELSRKLKEKMTADEQAEAERLAAAESLQQELEALRREKSVSSYKASYLALGYDEALAEETAAATVDGKMDVVFANQKKALDAQKQALIKERLEQTPTPPPGGKNLTAEQLNELSDEEYYKLINKKE